MNCKYDLGLTLHRQCLGPRGSMPWTAYPTTCLLAWLISISEPIISYDGAVIQLCFPNFMHLPIGQNNSFCDFWSHMANISINSQILIPFGGIFHIMGKFYRCIGPALDELPSCNPCYCTKVSILFLCFCFVDSVCTIADVFVRRNEINVFVDKPLPFIGRTFWQQEYCGTL